MSTKPSTLSFIIKNALILLPCAVAITLFLFYIDEGAYRLSWKDLQQNWGMFLGSVLSIFLAQCMLTYLLKGYKAVIRMPLTLALSIPLGFALLFGSVWLLLVLTSSI